MIEWFFDMCVRVNIRALKQLQAYSRSIAIADVDKKTMADSLAEITHARGKGSLQEYRTHAVLVQDYIQKRILEEADKRHMPYQFHTGMTTLEHSDPALLEPLIRRYRNVRFVLLHAYPFIRNAAYMARVYPNVWLDTSWLALQSPHILHNALNEYIGMASSSRITASIDATSLEEYAGGVAITREVLARVLSRKVENGYISEHDAYRSGEQILGKNTKELYTL